MCSSSFSKRRGVRRGQAAVLTAVSSTMLLGFVALSVDVGMLYNVRSELQTSADAAALAGSWELLDDDRLTGLSSPSAEILAAREVSVATGGLNEVLGSAPTIDQNYGNTLTGDIVVGYLNDPDDLSEVLSTANPSTWNSVQVLVRRDTTRNGSVPMYFANIFGVATSDVVAQATATLKNGAVGWSVTGTDTAELAPFALHVDSWNSLLDGSVTTGDSFTYDEATDSILPGGDSIDELNLYPGAGATQLPPGNFGTVDIGPPSNSTADLSRQIRYGVNAADLAYFGGEFKLGADGTIDVQGDTGLSAGIKDDLIAIIGEPRAIPLFSTVSGPGNNSTFTIVGFAGLRVLDVVLTGPMGLKQVIVQPAFVVSDAVITEAGSGTSSFVYEPPRLTR